MTLLGSSQSQKQHNFSLKFDSHNALVIPREHGPYSGNSFEKLNYAFNQLTNGGKSIKESSLKSPIRSGNFKLLPIPLSADQFMLPEVEELQSAFNIRQVESLVREWSGDNTLSLERASLQLNILTDGNESFRHEHRTKDRRKWALVTMIHRGAEGSIFWTEEPTLFPDTPGSILLRDLQPGDSIFFDASTYHGSTRTTGEGMVARAAWGFS